MLAGIQIFEVLERRVSLALKLFILFGKDAIQLLLLTLRRCLWRLSIDLYGIQLSSCWRPKATMRSEPHRNLLLYSSMLLIPLSSLAALPVQIACNVGFI